ncbi:MAG: Na+/H+ antiporter subunit E [Phycisphaeraceae bacterium]
MSHIFLLNLFLALVYAALVGDMSLFTLGVGFVLGYLVLSLYCRATGKGSYAVKVFRLLKFAFFFTRILVVANLEVAWEVITPGHTMTPRIIRYDVQGLTPVQITTLASIISLTPGTLSADVAEDAGHLYIHGMYGRDRAAAIRGLDEIKRRMIEEVFES